MKPRNEIQLQTVQLFEPDPEAVYSLETTEHIAHVPRRQIAIYCKHGLLLPVADPSAEGFYFNEEGIRTLRRIETLRNACGGNLVGIKMILHLLDEVELLRAEARFLRGQL